LMASQTARARIYERLSGFGCVLTAEIAFRDSFEVQLQGHETILEQSDGW
jgi:hypothetical protein